MRFKVTRFKELVSLLSSLDTDDRVEFIYYDEDQPPGKNKVSITLRFGTNFIKLHEVKAIVE